MSSNMSANMKSRLQYISHYPERLQQQIQQMIDDNALGNWLRARYPATHSVANDNDLRDYVMGLKNQYMKKNSTVE